jgi:hypothetical protein
LTIAAFVDVGHRQAHQMNTAPFEMRQRPPLPLHLIQDLLPFRIIGHRMYAWTGEDEMGIHVRRHMLREAVHHADRILEAIPARHLHDERRGEVRRRFGPLDVTMALDGAAEPSKRRNVGATSLGRVLATTPACSSTAWITSAGSS